MLLTILGSIDLIAGILLFLTVFNIGYGFSFFLILGIILLCKGLYSLAAHSLGAGTVDIVAALLLFLALWSIPLYYVITIIIGILLVIKGLQSMASEIFS